MITPSHKVRIFVASDPVVICIENADAVSEWRFLGRVVAGCPGPKRNPFRDIKVHISFTRQSSEPIEEQLDLVRWHFRVAVVTHDGTLG
ncbi:MAG: hypothetical protein CML03_13545 [Pseudooceanicola sp.]|nr:hypothetical protein [Pseudooceanicola sp.]